MGRPPVLDLRTGDRPPDAVGRRAAGLAASPLCRAAPTRLGGLLPLLLLLHCRGRLRYNSPNSGEGNTWHASLTRPVNR